VRPVLSPTSPLRSVARPPAPTLTDPPAIRILPPVPSPAALSFSALSLMALAVALVVCTAPVRVRLPVSVAISMSPVELTAPSVIALESTIEMLLPDTTDTAPVKSFDALLKVM